MPKPFSLFDLAPDKVVADRFRIVKPHRRSGLATSFEALDQHREGDAARCELMVFPGGLFEGPSQAEEFRDGWNEWMTIDSSNVQRVREVLDWGHSNMVLVCDFPPGRSLRAWLSAHGHMESARALELGRQLLDGLTEIHERGLVHGDIKPQTIFLQDEPLRGVLVDGGITTGLWSAKHLGEHTTLIGTPYYAPVEQFGGDSPNVQSDVYNVATVLFEVLCGVLPWPGSTILEVFQAKLNREPPSMATRAPDIEVDPAVSQAVLPGLAADRKARYRTAAAFRAALEAATVA